ncbi:MAG: deoxyguanosinetriphosphate triphosphohydrolase [Lentisphaeria bacterium]|nr:deoxyguanosinetriphosphate triphosphohydrolase [Lentisphaeria bacterium]
MSPMEWKNLLSPHRLCSELPGKITPERSPFQRDFDRIIFSGSFRRLQDKTQVFPLAQNDYVRTRLTHSMETSSIARSLGTAAGVFICNEFDTCGAHPSDIGAAVAAAALAHDIGNPPLGHAGEEAIRYWFTDTPEGQKLHDTMSAPEIADICKYDGNAQGFRILSRLEMPDNRGGMQLTCATLGCFAKYPGSAQSNLKKCGFFQQEAKLFAEVAEYCGMIKKDDHSWVRHPLSFLLEAADDIAYLTVDFEDAARLGMIEYSCLERLYLEIIDTERSRNYVRTLATNERKAEFLRAQAIGVLVRNAADVFIAHHDELMRGEFNSSLTEMIPQSGILAEIRERSVRDIYNHRSVAEVVGAGFELVQGMLDIFIPCVNEMALECAGKLKASYRSRRVSALLPVLHYPRPDEIDSTYTRLLRVLDYISGMTDRYAVALYQKLKGISL